MLGYEWQDPSIIHAGGDFFEGLGLLIKGEDKLVDTFFRFRPVRTLYSLTTLSIGAGIGAVGIGEGVNVITSLLEKLTNNSLPSPLGIIAVSILAGAISGAAFVGNIISNTSLAEAGRKERFQRKYRRQ